MDLSVARQQSGAPLRDLRGRRAVCDDTRSCAQGPYWTDREDEGSKTPLPICDVACGLAHTIALDVEGTMHSWGAGKNGQLGHRKCEPERRVPKMVSFKWKIKQIGAPSCPPCLHTRARTRRAFP